MSLLLGAPVAAQEHLTLAEAQRRATSGHAEVRVAAAAERQAASAADVARGGWMPRVDVAEGWQRGDMPVFAFSSLLSQRQFTAADFNVDRLNHPAAMDNFRTVLSLEQTVYDGSLGPANKTAGLGREVAASMARETGLRLTAAVVRAYGLVLREDALLRSVQAAVEAAAQDLERARQRRNAGMATDADVLTVEVHWAAMRSQYLSTEAERAIARAQLNDLVGAPLDQTFTLEPLPLPPAAAAIESLESAALVSRPDVQVARLNEEMAVATKSAAKGAFLPQVVARASTEWNGGEFASRASGWAVGAEARLNLFRGLTDRARLHGAEAAVDQRAAERAAVEGRARLEVRAARARAEAALARVSVADLAVARAKETQRIVRDRYENGMADVVSLLRAAEAALDADSQAIDARTDAALQQAALDLAVGR